MIVWLITNTCLTLFALLFLSTNKTSPHRLRFIISFTTLCCWLFPWNSLDTLYPDFLISNIVQIQESFPFRDVTLLSTVQIQQESIKPLEILMIGFKVLCGIGALLFLLNGFRHLQLITRLRNNSSRGNHLWVCLYEERGINFSVPLTNIYIQRLVPGALTTGLFSPVVWIHEDLIHNDNIAAILLHESRHIEHNDNIYLCCITLIEKLFWWNPLVKILSQQTRNMQELSCDESCAETMPTYRAMLSSLILSQMNLGAKAHYYPLGSSILKDANFNVHRIRILENKHKIKISHIMNCILVFIASFVAVSVVTAQDRSLHSALVSGGELKIGTLTSNYEQIIEVSPELIVVLVAENDIYNVNGQSIVHGGEKALSAAFIEAAKGDFNLPMVIILDPNSSFQALNTVLETGRLLGFSEMNVLTAQ